MNFADCCMDKLECRICMNCKNIHYEVYKPLDEMTTFIISVCYSLLFFTINAIINVYNYCLDV